MTAARAWNLADTFEQIAARLPEAPLFLHGDRRITWGESDRRSNGIAATLLAAGVREQDKVAQYLYNGPEYIESMVAAFKAGLATVNTNYRYTADELAYLWDNGDVVAVVFHGTFADTCAQLRARLPRIDTWLWVDDGTGGCPDWATPYEQAAASGTGTPVAGPWGRSGEHLVLLYTGGTTGMPKGVMWPQHDLIGAMETMNRRALPDDTANSTRLAERVVAPGPVTLPAAPMMHGTGLFSAFGVMMIGGAVVTTTSRRLDVVELLDTVERHAVKSLTVVGDAFAKPIIAALDESPGRWDLSSLRIWLSSGVMFAQESKDALLAHMPRLIIVDSYGSSEGLGLAASTTTAESRAEGAAGTARFQRGLLTKVIDDDGKEIEPGSGQAGMVAQRGFVPLGYYKDAAKSAATFRIIDGERYSVPGDWATVEADGTVRLLGRGSQVINTGGEKVHPEEIEESLKSHDDVADAAVVGVPDERFGQQIAAVVALEPGRSGNPDALDHHVREHLAGYKAPRRYVFVDSLNRSPNGKLDYKALAQIAYVEPAETP